MKYIRLSLITTALFLLNTSFYHYPDEFVLVVDKTDHQMQVFEGDKVVMTYQVVFGNNDMGDKMMSGDRKTPEGTFHINHMRNHNKWDKFMLLDYPTKESYEKFNERKRQGLIPANAKIGGDIGIHGTWPNDDASVDRKRNWTLGCISMKNEDVEELYDNLVVGTKVIIRR
jgi:murein L,D-transpeptidase YafK